MGWGKRFEFLELWITEKYEGSNIFSYEFKDIYDKKTCFFCEKKYFPCVKTKLIFVFFYI